MSRAGQIFRSYLWWTYPRGGFHYDVMVTLILAFIFLAPLWINFKDKPAEPRIHQQEVIVITDGHGGFIYQVDAAAIASSGPRGSSPRGEREVIEALNQVIEPIAGEVRITRYEPVNDRDGHPSAYKVWVQR